jgi:hypothetical protein
VEAFIIDVLKFYCKFIHINVWVNLFVLSFIINDFYGSVVSKDQ